MLVIERNEKELSTLFQTVKDNDLVRKPDDCKIGYIEKIQVDECTNTESNQKFNMVRLQVKCGRDTRTKSYSLEFYRRWLKQLAPYSINKEQYKNEEDYKKALNAFRSQFIVGAAVIFKDKKDRYRNISMFLPLTIDNEGMYGVFEYQDEPEDPNEWKKTLDKYDI